MLNSTTASGVAAKRATEPPTDALERLSTETYGVATNLSVLALSLEHGVLEASDTVAKEAIWAAVNTLREVAAQSEHQAMGGRHHA